MTITNRIRLGFWVNAVLLVVLGCVYVWGPALFGGGNQTGTVRIVVVVLGVIAAIAAVGFSVLVPRAIQRKVEGVVTEVGAAASQVRGIASQVASGAVQTATAISEAATTVDEVRQTSLLASQKSTALSDAAQGSEQVAEGGRLAVSEIIEGMGSIREQMGVVAETVVRLSEQSQAADQIISTTNQFAEQSNLLAVNAALEAAKAGEQGKGFSVVAEEIRNLATQSKKAVGQVRTILAEIQKATGAAVMATEHSGKTIEVNMHKAADSSSAIETLADGVEMSAQSSLQIAASSQQQLVGMDQISESMDSINSASAQNATAAQLMGVEVERLNDAMARLAALVGAAQNATPGAVIDTLPPAAGEVVGEIE